MEPFNEPLVEIYRDKWPTLLNLFKTYWPDGVVATCLLDTQTMHPAVTVAFNVHIFCPEGKLVNGMVATTTRQGHTQVIIQPIGKNVKKIEESLLTTKRIDWNHDIIFPSANAAAIECLERIKERLGINLYYGPSTKAYKHVLDRRSKKFEDIILPPNTYIGPLKPEHIDIVDETWTFKNKTSQEFFKILMDNKLCHVLYSIKVSEGTQTNKNKNTETSKTASTSSIEKDLEDKPGERSKELNKNLNDDSTKKSKIHEEKYLRNRDVEKAKENPIEPQIEKPMAWVSVNELGSLTHLFCIEKYRRKGRAKLILKYVVNELLSHNHNVLAYTMEDNISSKNLFKQLGFQDAGHDYWVIVNKKVKSVETAKHKYTTDVNAKKI